eukprot:Nk52_evm3s2474 gene=Nk52_evmTU3s2474
MTRCKHCSSRRHIFLLLLLLGTFIGITCAQTRCIPGSDSGSASVKKSVSKSFPTLPIKIFKYNWIGTQISSEILKILFEEKLNRAVEYVTPLFDYDINFQMLENGTAHLDIELWAQFSQRQKFIVERQTVLDAGPNGLVGSRGWYTPKYMTDFNPRYDYWREYLKPSSVSVFSSTNTSSTFAASPTELRAKLDAITLTTTAADAVTLSNEVKAQLAIMESDLIPSTSANQAPMKLYSPYPLWGVPDPQIVKNLGLNIDVIGLTESNMEGALLSELQKSLDTKSPHLTYFWGPHSIHSSLSSIKLVKVNLPQWSQECEVSQINATHGGVNCDYGTSPLIKVVSQHLPSVSAEAMTVIRRFSLTNSIQNELMGQVSYGNRSIYNVSCEWIRNNEKLWSAWMPQTSTVTGDISSLENYEIALIAIGAFVFMFSALVATMFWVKQSNGLSRTVFLIDEMELSNISNGSFVSIFSAHSITGQNRQNVRKFRGVNVLLQTTFVDNFKLTKSAIRTMNEILQSHHPNIVSVIGLSITPTFTHVVCEYFQGTRTLSELLKSQLEWTDKMTLYTFQSIIMGLQYLHNSMSSGFPHGHLNLNTVLIDSSWGVRLTGFSIPHVHTNINGMFMGILEEEEMDDVNKLFVAPEVLTGNVPSKSGDIYSLAMITFCLCDYDNRYPFERETANFKHELVTVLQTAMFHRPNIHPDSSPESITSLLGSMWDTKESERLSLSQIKHLLKHRLSKKEQKLEQLVLEILGEANDLLSRLADERTEALRKESNLSNTLLCKMVPPSIAKVLLRGKVPAPEKVESCTILFTDIVGFTMLCSRTAPEDIVNLLNSLYCSFDDITAQYDVYKIETIGDAYFLVSGCPNPNGDAHSVIIAEVALELLNAVMSFESPSTMEGEAQKIEMRLGIHTGPVVAAVVGNIMPRYSIFGDSVNTASRMESSSLPMKIQVSEASYECLKDAYYFEDRGVIELKGKGPMQTYWLQKVKNALKVSSKVVKKSLIIQSSTKSGFFANRDPNLF